RIEDRRPAAPQTRRVDAAYLLEAAQVRRLTLGKLDERRIGEHRTDRTVLGDRGALAPGGELAGHSPGARIELIDARQPFPSSFGIALVGRRLQPPALLDRPAEPAAAAKATLDLVGELEQVSDVLGRVAELFVGQRAGVPPRVAGRLVDAAPENRAEQVRVAGLCAAAGKARCDLRVEDVVELGAPRTPQDRHVLASGV